MSIFLVVHSILDMSIFRHSPLYSKECFICLSGFVKELLREQGMQLLKAFHKHKHTTSIVDDFAFYENRAIMYQRARQQQPPPGAFGEEIFLFLYLQILVRFKNSFEIPVLFFHSERMTFELFCSFKDLFSLRITLPSL